MVYAEFGSDEMVERNLDGRMKLGQARKLLSWPHGRGLRFEWGQSLPLPLQ
jgi:hypothetical protein